jgi:hypothetical protein
MLCKLKKTETRTVVLQYTAMYSKYSYISGIVRLYICARRRPACICASEEHFGEGGTYIKRARIRVRVCALCSCVAPRSTRPIDRAGRRRVAEVSPRRHVIYCIFAILQATAVDPKLCGCRASMLGWRLARASRLRQTMVHESAASRQHANEGGRQRECQLRGLMRTTPPEDVHQRTRSSRTPARSVCAPCPCPPRWSRAMPGSCGTATCSDCAAVGVKRTPCVRE